MENETLKKNIEDEVAKIFSAKEEAEVRKQTEDTLVQSAETIEALTASVNDKSDVIDYLSAVGEELNKEVSDLTSKLEAAEKEISKVSEKLSESESAVVEMEKDIATEKRIKELESAEVLTDTEAQTAKVRDMSDEDFVAYKDDRVALREAVVSELTANKEEEVIKKDEEVADEETATEEEVADGGEVATEEDDETPLANVDPNVAVSGLMNMEVASDDMISKYQELGKAIKL